METAWVSDKTAARMAEEETLLASARRQMREGRWVTFAALMADSGLPYSRAEAVVNGMRRASRWPYKVVGRRQGGKPARDTVEIDYAADAAAALARRREIVAEAVKDMGDGRGEVDDPKTHGLLAVPRSLPLPARAEASEVGRWIAEARRIRRRLGIGAKGKARRRAA